MDDIKNKLGFGCMCMGMSIPALAWLTHVLVCIGTRDFGFLFIGALFFPVAIIHGLVIWVAVIVELLNGGG
jgi:hypothetical protein